MGALGAVLTGGVGMMVDPLDDRWYQSRNGTGEIVVSDFTSMGLAPFYAGVTAISEDMAKVRFGVFEDLGDKGRRSAREHPVHHLIHSRPNPWQTSLEWREMITAFALLRGKGISEIRSGPRGVVDQIVPLHPDLIREDTADDGTRRYHYRDPIKGNRERLLLAEDLHILRGRFGRSVIDFARDQVTEDIAQQRASLMMFTRGSRHLGVMQHPKLLSKTARENLRRALDEFAVGGAKAGRPMLLEEGMTWQNVSITAKDAEWAATHQWSVQQWARFFRMPEAKLQGGSAAADNKQVQIAIDYVTDSLLGWAGRWEQTCNRDLLGEGPFFTKLTLDSLMKGDPKSRFEAYALAVQWGWMSRNEVRALEDMNPIEGFDEPLTPLNMGRGSQGTTGPTSQATNGYLRLLASDAADRLVRRESAAVAKLAERTGGTGADWEAGLTQIYADHAVTVARDLHVPDHVARRYVADQRARLADVGVGGMSDWMTERVPALAAIAMEQHRTEIAA